MKKKLTFIDLFSGAGGLSEGFIRQGFTAIAHVELDEAASFTLKTRAAYHYLHKKGKGNIYNSYLKGEKTRDEFYKTVPKKILGTVINAAIGKDNKEIFKSIDKNLRKKRVDIIIGGPPCQAYSVVGRAPLKHKTNDERTKLYIQYGRFLSRYQPKIFVFENVPGILSAAEGQYFKNLQKYYKSLGYRVEAKVLNAYDYGVVQHRQRVIIIGWKKELNHTYPKIAKSRKKYYRKDIFTDLPKISAGAIGQYHSYVKSAGLFLKKTKIRNGVSFVTQHISRPHNRRDLNIYKLAIRHLSQGDRLTNDKIPFNMRTQKNVTSFLDRFKVVSKEPHTMIAHISKDGHHFIHPDITQLRSISVREAARIQSFPDSYYFEGAKEKQNRTAAFRQIGNAVPPVMAAKIAEAIKSLY